jgi:hypothetical protein
MAKLPLFLRFMEQTVKNNLFVPFFSSTYGSEDFCEHVLEANVDIAADSTVIHV